VSYAPENSGKREEGRGKREKEQGVPPEGVEPPQAMWPTTF